MNQIQKTKDYTIFNKLEGNRKIIKSHIKKLKESIEKDNQLNLHPIIVNKNMEIIDGQHRLEVAKILGLDIFYLLGETVSDSHLIECNVNQKIFDCENFIHYFAVKERIEDYVELQKRLDYTGLKPKAFLTLILGSVSPSILEFLKTGKFRFPKNNEWSKISEDYLNFVSYVKDKRISPFSMFTNYNFTKAFRWLCLTQGFAFQIFFNKLDLKWFDLKPQRNAEEWYKLLISIYNFKNHTKLAEEYGEKV